MQLTAPVVTRDRGQATGCRANREWPVTPPVVAGVAATRFRRGQWARRCSVQAPVARHGLLFGRSGVLPVENWSAAAAGARGAGAAWRDSPEHRSRAASAGPDLQAPPQRRRGFWQLAVQTAPWAALSAASPTPDEHPSPQLKATANLLPAPLQRLRQNPQGPPPAAYPHPWVDGLRGARWAGPPEARHPTRLPNPCQDPRHHRHHRQLHRRLLQRPALQASHECLASCALGPRASCAPGPPVSCAPGPRAIVAAAAPTAREGAQVVMPRPSPLLRVQAAVAAAAT
mmetsp:Transcript_12654/g.36943  ORF Transcript_12654/g.36943 Transcript_12654/m.36943 type:complete len:286 (-) Transcript_12654:105-962(-)|eukprot:365011-Chlamydomonas_euryale.AAC.2